MPSLRRIAAGLVAASLGFAALTASPHQVPGYLLRQGLHQASMLYGRMPVSEARRRGLLSEDDEAALERVDDILAFGAEIGLFTGERYTSIHPSWDKTVYNVSACQPDAFKPVRWSFPVVGRLPYLGFFDEVAATSASRHLRQRGYDVYQRTAGAYSMLGWLEDPLLPHMLRWNESRLSSTLLHELTHATLWVPGSVAFNESFANFVGQEAALRYLIARHGDDSDEVAREHERREDREAYAGMLRELYMELDTLYQSDRPREDKLRAKAAILAALPQRTAGLGLHQTKAYVRSVRSGEWNNARLVQYRTYNRSSAWFEALLEQENGDLVRFIDRVEALGRSGEEPYAALAHAVGADPEEAMPIDAGTAR
ncbi:MAG: hypothetical protein EP330_18115 [Deltaproteobacteria bacterium]|nr:MAG: hypothetical protein EP330_18115 [Deltaproteobacteria bacterium]